MHPQKSNKKTKIPSLQRNLTEEHLGVTSQAASGSHEGL